jgi:hypothetical protein
MGHTLKYTSTASFSSVALSLFAFILIFGMVNPCSWGSVIDWNKEQQEELKSTVFWDITPCSPLKVDFEFQRTTRRYAPEDRSPNNHRCENIRSYKSSDFSVGLHTVIHWSIQFSVTSPPKVNHTPDIETGLPDRHQTWLFVQQPAGNSWNNTLSVNNQRPRHDFVTLTYCMPAFLVLSIFILLFLNCAIFRGESYELLI